MKSSNIEYKFIRQVCVSVDFQYDNSFYVHILCKNEDLLILKYFFFANKLKSLLIKDFRVFFLPAKFIIIPLDLFIFLRVREGDIVYGKLSYLILPVYSYMLNYFFLN